MAYPKSLKNDAETIILLAVENVRETRVTPAIPMDKIMTETWTQLVLYINWNVCVLFFFLNFWPFRQVRSKIIKYIWKGTIYTLKTKLIATYYALYIV